MQQGELIVTGTNSIEIPLHRFPSEVRAHFKDNGPEPVPCDPGDVDTLEYEVQNTGGKFILIVRWSVSSVREIKWNVSY